MQKLLTCLCDTDWDQDNPYDKCLTELMLLYVGSALQLIVNGEWTMEKLFVFHCPLEYKV